VRAAGAINGDFRRAVRAFLEGWSRSDGSRLRIQLIDSFYNRKNHQEPHQGKLLYGVNKHSSR